MSEAEEQAAREHTTARLYWHVLEKGFQTGALVGLPVAAVGAYRRRGMSDALGALSLRTLGRSAISFSVAAGLATAAMIALKPIDQEGIDDRAYRLYWNAGQNRTDKFSQVGAAAGTAAAVLTYGMAPSVLLGGAAAGSAMGVLTHVVSAFPELATAENVPIDKDALPK